MSKSDSNENMDLDEQEEVGTRRRSTRSRGANIAPEPPVTKSARGRGRGGTRGRGRQSKSPVVEQEESSSESAESQSEPEEEEEEESEEENPGIPEESNGVGSEAESDGSPTVGQTSNDENFPNGNTAEITENFEPDEDSSSTSRGFDGSGGADVAESAEVPLATLANAPSSSEPETEEDSSAQGTLTAQIEVETPMDFKEEQSTPTSDSGSEKQEIEFKPTEENVAVNPDCEGSDSPKNDPADEPVETGIKRKLETDEEEDRAGNEIKKEKKEWDPSKKPHLDEEVQAMLPDLQKYWKPVEEDPSDFSGWTHLLQYVDHADLIPAAREAYDGFLARYPYCYGYWKKYADYEKRKGSVADCEQVFDRGLKAIPLSVDLWVHYMNYIKSTYESDANLVRSKYKDAIEACGMEFRSDKLWEHYIHWEMESRNWQNVLGIYDQLIRLPTQSHKTHFEKLEAFVNDHLPSEVLDAAELYNLTVEEVSEEEAEVLEKGAESGNTDAWQEKVLELTPKLREKIIESRNKVYATNVAEVASRWPFEEAIKRPYFHVKPVEKTQLKMWKEYLDFEIEKGDLKRIIVLFERCLIACAMYEDYWEKYLQFLQTQEPLDIPRIQDVFTRICTIHHQKKARFHLQRAAFEEKQGNLDTASETYEVLESNVPPALPIYNRHINFERRRGNLSKCKDLFEKYIKACDNKVLSVHMTIKYARFTNVWLKAYDKAVELLKAAIDIDESTRSKVFMALVDLGMHATPADVELVLATFDQAIAAVSKEKKIEFTQRKLEFVEDYANSIASILAVEDEFQSISKAAPEKPGPDPIPAHGPESGKDPHSSFSSSGPPSGYDQYGGGGGGPSNYGSQYNQYGHGPGPGQYSGNWNSGQGQGPSGPSNYGPSYGGQGNWNSSYYG